MRSTSPAPYGSDLRLYAAQDVPTLHDGPGDPRVAHTADEHVGLAETVAVAQTLVVATLRLLRKTNGESATVAVADSPSVGRLG